MLLKLFSGYSALKYPKNTLKCTLVQLPGLKVNWNY